MLWVMFSIPLIIMLGIFGLIVLHIVWEMPPERLKYLPRTTMQCSQCERYWDVDAIGGHTCLISDRIRIARGERAVDDAFERSRS